MAFRSAGKIDISYFMLDLANDHWQGKSVESNYIKVVDIGTLSI